MTVRITNSPPSGNYFAASRRATASTMATASQSHAPSMVERLQHSVLAGSLSIDVVIRMAQTHFSPSSDADAERLKTLVQTNQKSLWVRQSAALGTLQNGKVAVGLSAVGSTATITAAAATGADGDGLAKQELPRFLGLFSVQAIAKGSWVTVYGGIQEWPGARRSQVRNTHSRRIPDSGWIWNGRAWALLFSARLSAASFVPHLHLSPFALMNVLLQLEHEAFHVGELEATAADLVRSTARGGKKAAQCSSNCKVCQAHGQALPNCGCCGVELGLLPCEFAAVFSDWKAQDCQIYDKLVVDVRKRIEQEGVGYMANTSSNKADLNVQCVAVSPYTAAISAIHPKQLVYQATRDIAAGEEILVAYNNNESKQF